jgi:hypothetical protein
LIVRQTKRAIVKETLAGRLHVSPANTYEVSQLYAVGALSVACIGLQCVGYDAWTASALLAHAADLLPKLNAKHIPNDKTNYRELKTSTTAAPGTVALPKELNIEVARYEGALARRRSASLNVRRRKK